MLMETLQPCRPRIGPGPLPALSRVRNELSIGKEEKDHANRNHRASDLVRCRPRSGYRPVYVPADATLQGNRPLHLRSRQRFRNRLPPPRAQPPPLRTDLLRSTFSAYPRLAATPIFLESAPPDSVNRLFPEVRKRVDRTQPEPATARPLQDFERTFAPGRPQPPPPAVEP